MKAIAMLLHVIIPQPIPLHPSKIQYVAGREGTCTFVYRATGDPVDDMPGNPPFKHV